MVVHASVPNNSNSRRIGFVIHSYIGSNVNQLNGKVYVFQGNEKLMLDYAYDNYLTKNEGYLKINKTMNKEYETFFVKNKLTDTIIAVATK